MHNRKSGCLFMVKVKPILEVHRSISQWLELADFQFVQPWPVTGWSFSDVVDPVLIKLTCMPCTTVHIAHTAAQTVTEYCHSCWNHSQVVKYDTSSCPFVSDSLSNCISKQGLVTNLETYSNHQGKSCKSFPCMLLKIMQRPAFCQQCGFLTLLLRCAHGVGQAGARCRMIHE